MEEEIKLRVDTSSYERWIPFTTGKYKGTLTAPMLMDTATYGTKYNGILLRLQVGALSLL